jgi:hypothetical protein
LLKKLLHNQSSSFRSFIIDSCPELTPTLTPEVIQSIHADMESFQISAGFKRLHVGINDQCLLKFAQQTFKIQELRILDAPLVTPIGVIAIVRSWLEVDDNHKRNLVITIGSRNNELYHGVDEFFNKVPKLYPGIKAGFGNLSLILRIGNKRNRVKRRCDVNIF